MSKYVSTNAASIRFKRTKFNLTNNVKTSIPFGKLVPIKIVEVLAGDSMKGSLTAVLRTTSSFIKPIMGDMFLDHYTFFVPSRILYDSWENVFGQASPSEWNTDSNATVPVTTSASTVSSGTIADYLGLPVGYVPKGINILPFRAFAMIWNEWFRNENLQYETYVHKGSKGSDEVINNNDWAPDNYFGKLPPVCKQKDYFTACLPKPQKGEPVEFGMTGLAQLTTAAGNYVLGNALPTSNLYPHLGFNTLTAAGKVSANGWKSGSLGTVDDEGANGNIGIDFDGSVSEPFEGDALSTNIYADLSHATAISVNDFRLAVQVQKLLEKDARYGTRYREYLLGHFGVLNSDARMQIPEFLGGGRIPVQVQQVASTYNGTTGSLAQLGAYSLSADAYSGKWQRSFTEPGFVITVACIRQLHTYQQGIERLWFRNSKLDYYDPLFANIGEQPVYTTQLVNGSGVATDLKANVFGYNEAFAELRFIPNSVTGQMRSGITNTLEQYALADYYSTNAGEYPVLDSEFVSETDAFLSSRLSVATSSQDPFIADINVNIDAIRVMPLYSIPGLVDHH